MIERLSQKLIEKRLSQYPAVTLVEPCQCGKTTLARMIGGNYFDLEQPSEQLRLDLKRDDLMESDTLVILDEALPWPDVFPRLRGAIDHDRKRMGRFLLLGSVSPWLYCPNELWKYGKLQTCGCSRPLIDRRG